MRTEEPFLEHGGNVVVEADARRAVATQAPAPELENHAGVRHAGALFALGYAASRALVAATPAGADSVDADMVDSEIAYEKVVGGGTVTAIAEPAAEDWEGRLEQASAGQGVRLPVTVTLRNEEGTTVAQMAVSWQVSPVTGGASG
jgi:acyl-coenzyme A thioesterase PaaI-like protein